MKTLWLAIMTSAILASHDDVCAQSATEEAAVRELVHALFKAMQNGDSAAVHSLFTNDVTLVSVFKNRQSEPVRERDASIDQFLKVIGTPHPQPYIEETWNMDVRIDADLAQVWCDYALYVGNTFSHCGVDAFHLHKTKNGWRIFHLADTRRVAGCYVPDEITQKHK